MTLIDTEDRPPASSVAKAVDALRGRDALVSYPKTDTQARFASSAPRWGWEWALERLDYAFQPIVNIHNGVCFGMEALLRNWREAGFESIQEVFDAAAESGILAEVDSKLREKAVRRFAEIPGSDHFKLFYNVDNRCAETPSVVQAASAHALSRHDLPSTALYLEISERHDLARATHLPGLIESYRDKGYKLVLDDYGVGFSQLKMLYHCEPDVIKVDRFFVSGIDTDRRKEMLVAQLVELAHLMGTTVVAEGVETAAEYYVCKRIGCDLVQGYLIQEPTLDLQGLTTRYPRVEDLARHDRRGAGDDRALITERMTRIKPLTTDTDAVSVLHYFLEYHEITVVPVVDEQGYPVGMIREADFKEFSYSHYGRDLLQNPYLRPRLDRFLRRCATVDIAETVEHILKVFASAENQDGVIVTQDMRYVGFLDGLALLEMLNEKNTVAARDQNPLTQLPGNNAIYRYASEALAESATESIFIYFDFDNFKPFNDAFGFRQGDRAILLFSELLQKKLFGSPWFVGHVGGDDFFVGVKGVAYPDVVIRVRKLLDGFREQIASFYDPDSRALGAIEGVDRDGKERQFPLMTVSAAMLQLPPRRGALSVDDVSPLISVLKRAAKEREDHLCAAGLVPVAEA